MKFRNYKHIYNFNLCLVHSQVHTLVTLKKRKLKKIGKIKSN